ISKVRRYRPRFIKKKTIGNVKIFLASLLNHSIGAFEFPGIAPIAQTKGESTVSIKIPRYALKRVHQTLIEAIPITKTRISITTTPTKPATLKPRSKRIALKIPPRRPTPDPKSILDIIESLIASLKIRMLSPVNIPNNENG